MKPDCSKCHEKCCKPHDTYLYLIELRGVHDGWSIGVTAEGEWVNRWPVDDFRYAKTQEYIDSHNQLVEGTKNEQ